MVTQPRWPWPLPPWPHPADAQSGTTTAAALSAQPKLINHPTHSGPKCYLFPGKDVGHIRQLEFRRQRMPVVENLQLQIRPVKLVIRLKHCHPHRDLLCEQRRPWRRIYSARTWWAEQRSSQPDTGRSDDHQPIPALPASCAPRDGAGDRTRSSCNVKFHFCRPNLVRSVRMQLQHNPARLQPFWYQSRASPLLHPSVTHFLFKKIINKIK